MKVKYTFPVEGTLPIGPTKILEKGTACYEFKVGEMGFVTELIVTKQADSNYKLPQIAPSATGPAKMNINIQSNGLDDITILQVQALQNFLCYFGLHKIDTQYFETTWVPESEEEEEAIKLFSHKVHLGQAKAEGEVIPLDLIARCVAASENLTTQSVLVPLSFYRKGRSDFYQGNYLDACYDFYFMLETLFADGKFKTQGVKEAFSKAVTLQKAISQVISGTDFLPQLMARYPQKYKEVIEGKTATDISKWLVDFRGDVHHHSLKKNSWNPESYDNFKFEADLMQYIAYGVAGSIIMTEMFNESLSLKFTAKELVKK